MDDRAPFGLELIERDESGNITAVITEGPGGGGKQINVVVSRRSRVSAGLPVEQTPSRVPPRARGMDQGLWPLTGKTDTGE